MTSYHYSGSSGSYSYSHESTDSGESSYSYTHTEYHSDSTSNFSSTTQHTIVSSSTGFGTDLIKRTFDPAQTIDFAGQDYETLKKQCLAYGELFDDDVFPANDLSLFYSQLPPQRFEWKRPSEISDDPRMFVDGASRFDISQGILGDCWFLAAIAALTQDDILLKQVIPDGQDFDQSDYCGIFRFRFWQYGEWKEIVIDDKLPTYNGRLVFVYSKAPNEFWSALLEKAYAKLHGSYEALKGGLAGEAMEDFTGGLSYSVLLKNAPDNLYDVMSDALSFQSLICAAIEARDSSEVEKKLSNGLVKGHAYTISSIKEVTLKGSFSSAIEKLVRVRNPWGNEREWNGPWGDRSQEWEMLSDDEKESIGLQFDHDGEFWISINDFMENFTRVEICMLSPENSGHVSGTQWQMIVYEGSWQRYLTAGGCRNFPDSFHLNPQYTIILEDCDHDDDDHSTLVIGLMQKNRRKLRSLGSQNLTIGFAIYKMDDEAERHMVEGKLNKEYFLYNRSAARSDTFINSREVVGRFALPPGKYVVIPSTFAPNEEGDFVLRLFAERQHSCDTLDSDIHINCIRAKARKEDNVELLKTTFEAMAGQNGELNAYELQRGLKSLMESEDVFEDDPTLEACRSMVAFMDKQRVGRLNFQEFQQLHAHLIKWKKAFNEHDVDSSGDMNAVELRQLLSGLDLQVGTDVLSSVVLRYANEEGSVKFDDVVQICCRITTVYEAFKKFQGQAFTANDEGIPPILNQLPS